MLYWLKRYDEQNNNTMTIEIFKSYISNKKTGGSDGGARPLPASTARHVVEPSPARPTQEDGGSDGGVRPLPVSTRWRVAEPPPAGGRRKMRAVMDDPADCSQHTLIRGRAPACKEELAKRKKYWVCWIEWIDQVIYTTTEINPLTIKKELREIRGRNQIFDVKY